MERSAHVGTQLAIALCLLGLPPAHAAEATQPSLYEEGLVAYERGHDAEAAAYFRRAAEGGDVRSAEMLALMYRFGPRLFGPGVAADAAESARWAGIAAEGRRRDVAAALTAR